MSIVGDPTLINGLRTSSAERSRPEVLAVGPGSSTEVAFSGEPESLTVTGLELSYELAYLRIFGFWESFLEQCFVRLLCGYERGSNGPETMLTGQPYSSKIEDAVALQKTDKLQSLRCV